jgi:hypothetical protein
VALGCVEVKRILSYEFQRGSEFRTAENTDEKPNYEKNTNTKNYAQFASHIHNFCKVVYTNGLEWRLYEYNKKNAVEIIVLGEIKKLTGTQNKDDCIIVWKDEKEYKEEFYRLCKMLQKFFKK